MAKIIKPDGTEEEITIPTGSAAWIATMQQAVGGYVGVMCRNDPADLVMFGDEEATLKRDVQPNPRATALIREWLGTDNTVEILGPVVVCRLHEGGFTPTRK